MAAELIRRGVLQEGEYLNILQKICDDREVSVVTCEVILEAVQAWECERPVGGKIVHHERSRTVYADLLEKCLVPYLLDIIGRHSVKAFSYHENHINHANGIPQDSAKSKSKIADDGRLIRKATLVNNDVINSMIKEKVTETIELKLVPKLSCLIVYLLGILSAAEKDGFSLDQQVNLQPSYLSLIQVFEKITESLSELTLDNIVAVNELHRVKILSLIIANLLRDKSCQQRDEFMIPVKTIVDISLNLVKGSHDADITAVLLTLIVQPYLESVIKGDAIVMKLWHIVKDFYAAGEDFITEEKNATGFLILCFLSEHTSRMSLPLENDDMFWKIIQHGLIHPNPLSRKRSQYVLKRAVDICTSSTANGYSKYMLWQMNKKKEIEKLWYDFFLLIETLEEKQAHVIKPVLEKLDRLILASSKNGFHVSWVLIIFHRIFSHDNKNIRQWGLMKFLNLKFPEEVLMNGFLSFVTCHLISVLSDYLYYARDPGLPPKTSSAVGDQLIVFFRNIISSLSISNQRQFLCSLLETIFDGRPWGGIPLFYLLRSVAQIPCTRVWNYKVVKNATVNFEGCLSTQDVTLRSGSQCDLLKAVFKHLSVETSLIEICDIVGHFRRKESWCRGTGTWEMIIDGLDVFNVNYDNSSVHKALAASMSSLDCKDIVHPSDMALGINLLMEKNCRKNDNNRGEFYTESLLKPVTNFLRDCHMRPYLDQKKLAWTLQVVAATLEIRYDVPSDNQGTELKHDGDLSCLVSGIISVAQLFINHMDMLNQPHDLDTLTLYLQLFGICSSAPPLRSTMKNLYVQILEKCKSLLEKADPVKVSFGIIVLEHLLLFHYKVSGHSIREEYHQLFLQRIVHNIPPLTQRRGIEGYKSTEFTSNLLLETTRSCWSCIDVLITKKELGSTSSLAEIESTVEAFLTEAVSTLGRLNAVHVFQVAVSLAPSVVKANLWQELVELMWRSSSEFRKGCDLYRTLIGYLSDLLFHRDAIVKPDNHKFIVQISQKLLATGEAAQGIAAHMARSLIMPLSERAVRDALPSGTLDELMQDVLVPLLMFGYVFRKQFKIVQDTVEYIQHSGTTYSTNILLESNWDADQRARAITLRFLLSLNKEKSSDRSIAEATVQGIRYQYAKCTGDRRDFGNSQSHRYKTRLLQAFLLLLPLLDEEECLLSLSWLCKGLIKDHQQPSVRYIQEWGIALIVIFHPNFYPHLLKHFLEGSKERVGCVGSFLASLTHVACTTEEEEVLSQAIQYTLPWCMAQHFNTRLYAQVSLRKIWHHCQAINATAVLDKYEPMQQCLQFVVEQGSAARNTLNMLNDFYFKVFHPVQHYTLQTIVYDLPCLSLLANDEWLTVDFIMGAIDSSILPVRSEIPLHNMDKVLAESSPAPWVIKAAGETSFPEDNEVSGSPVLNVQRKITPWKSMISELTAPLDLPDMAKPKQQRGGLILVASLIDKPPNLGGLCRTCEVFSVQEYVVPSLAVLEDQTFNSLSLTAQQWVPVKEVKPDNIAEYLRTLQNEGYTLVAAEQTANSKKLSEYSFPERTAVILGNEREGIPCELLQLLDVCVEIPQFGIIRSLNVHVSGALFIWEYTRQHLTKPTSG